MRTIKTDAVVLGAGSGGCAAAHRLRTRGASVLVVEAGPDYGSIASGRWPQEILDPARVPLSHDWGFTHAGIQGRHSGVSRARIVGGCSSHNECAAVWALPSDYDRWAEHLGDPSWSYRSVRPLIDQIERCADGGEWRGKDGLLPTMQYERETMAAWQGAFVDAAIAAGYPLIDDISDAAPTGVAGLHANIQDGMRWNAGFAFLDPLRGEPGFLIEGSALVDRLVFEGDRAVAVECLSGDGELRIEADHVVLAGGAFGSPTILLRSGVGDPDELRRIGIEAVIDLPGVGRRLQDHIGVVLPYELTERGQAALEQDLATGRFSQSQVLMRVPTAAGDGFIHLLPYQMQDDLGVWITSVLAYAMNPTSSGKLTLTDSDPITPPQIELGYHSDPSGHDAEILHHGAALLREITAQAPLSELAEGELPATRDATGERLDAYIKGTPISYAHQISTCRMGAADDELAVADSTGLVRGTANVYVADASAFPDMPSANTNLTCMLVGWQVAARLGDHSLSSVAA